MSQLAVWRRELRQLTPASYPQFPITYLTSAIEDYQASWVELSTAASSHLPATFQRRAALNDSRRHSTLSKYRRTQLESRPILRNGYELKYTF